MNEEVHPDQHETLAMVGPFDSIPGGEGKIRAIVQSIPILEVILFMRITPTV